MVLGIEIINGSCHVFGANPPVKINRIRIPYLLPLVSFCVVTENIQIYFQRFNGI